LRRTSKVHYEWKEQNRGEGGDSVSHAHGANDPGKRGGREDSKKITENARGKKKVSRSGPVSVRQKGEAGV